MTFFSSPHLEKRMEVELSPNNFGIYISGKVFLGDKPNVHEVHLRDYDKDSNILRGEAVLLRPECNGYLKDLLEDGWKEIPKP
jgi:hypothetical protein